MWSYSFFQCFKFHSLCITTQGWQKYLDPLFFLDFLLLLHVMKYVLYLCLSVLEFKYIPVTYFIDFCSEISPNKHTHPHTNTYTGQRLGSITEQFVSGFSVLLQHTEAVIHINDSTAHKLLIWVANLTYFYWEQDITGMILNFFTGNGSYLASINPAAT